eukprot:TRINITY_DN12408_c0_g1_i1.p1 TRINITY_DN12408_c0_g1~~TRINITY_DN12408_c0_g1_i1.p1  ORF type:complete len:518 (-),score=154.87 TRINITY_DN12408_c0_g1_i1:33-1382(-)
MRKITHPNVCLFMGAAAETSGLKIVTELLKGDVEGLIFNSASATSLLQRIRWCKDAAQGMAWLHGNNPCIIHRDLKPSNLLIDASGTVKVTDFGLSDLIQQGQQVREVRPKGSPIYMAPEVMLRTNLTPKVDVYSFGIVVWEIVKKEAAFSNYNDYAKFSNAVISGERPPVNGIHPVIVEFLNQCWNKDPNLRPEFPEICSLLDSIMLKIGIEDKKAREFWRENFNGQLRVPWNEFVDRLFLAMHRVILLHQDCELSSHPTDQQISEASPLQRREFARRTADNYRKIYTMYENEELTDLDYMAVCLRILFVNQGSSEVDMEFFGHMIDLVGPFERNFLDRFMNMVNSKWFHGTLSKADSEKLLRKMPDGTYLIRFSTNSPKHYVISKAEAGSVKHILVPYRAGEGFIEKGRVFPTFDDLLKEKAGPLNLKEPFEASIFRDMTTKDNPYM